MNYLEELKSNEIIFLTFLSEKYPFHYNSNLFLRDLQYAINSYFKLKGINLRFSETEKLALDYAANMVRENKFTSIDSSTWKVIVDITSAKKVILEEKEI